jgi:MFS family permease
VAAHIGSPVTLRASGPPHSDDDDDDVELPLLPEQNVTLPQDPSTPNRAGMREAPDQKPLSRTTIILLIIATIGAGIATIVPMAFTLALKLDQIAPGREELLGFILGANAVSSLLTSPLTGILSDRTRTRWGRRRPYTVAGIALGIAATPVLIFAEDPVTLAVGWILVSFGFGTAMGSIGNFQADRLPPSQRGKVSGLAGLAMQVAPVFGILLAGMVSQDIAWVFLLPALVGVALMLVFVVFVHEADSRGLTFAEPLSFSRVVRSYGFSPRSAPDFAWNWLGRFVFFFGLSLTTSFSTFFYAQRLGVPVSEVVSVLAITASMSIVSAVIGSVGAGWLSDKTGRRRPFIVLAVLLAGTGFSLSAFAWDLPMLLCGAFISSLGIAMFFAVNQAMTLDILPDRDAEAGRYMAITSISQRVPTALAPLLAPLLLAIAAEAGEKNYASIYVAAAAFSVVGGLIIAVKVKGAR